MLRKIPISVSVDINIFEEMKKRNIRNTEVFEEGLKNWGINVKKTKQRD
jgi:hypothetical protein